jgi:hypothetical protein
MNPTKLYFPLVACMLVAGLSLGMHLSPDLPLEVKSYFENFTVLNFHFRFTHEILGMQVSSALLGFNCNKWRSRELLKSFRPSSMSLTSSPSVDTIS